MLANLIRSYSLRATRPSYFCCSREHVECSIVVDTPVSFSYVAFSRPSISHSICYSVVGPSFSCPVFAVNHSKTVQLARALHRSHRAAPRAAADDADFYLTRRHNSTRCLWLIYFLPLRRLARILATCPLFIIIKVCGPAFLVHPVE